MLGIGTRIPLPTAISLTQACTHPLTNPDHRTSASPSSPGQTIRNTRYATVFSVIREIEIWRVAVLMVNRYADEAKANSFRRAEELAGQGDHAGAAIWRRITVAIEQLTDTTGLPN